MVGVAGLAVILGLRFAAPAVPGALVLVVGGLLASSLLKLGEHGVALVGEVPSGLPMPVLTDASLFTDNAASIGIDAFALLLIGFSQTAGDARAFATKHRYRIDVNQESIAQGMANAGSGLFQGMPVTAGVAGRGSLKGLFLAADRRYNDAPKPPGQANRVSAGSRSPRSSARSTSTHAMPRASASTRACGLTIWAASTPRQSALPGSSRIRSR